MPVQTSQTGKIRIPDGAKVSVKESGAGAYTDIGAISGDVNVTLNWTEVKVETGNAGTPITYIKDMSIAGDFALIQWDPDNIERLGAGIFENVATAGGSVSSIDNQVIASGAASDVTPYNLEIIETGGSALKVSSSLVIASVTGATDGVLAANDDYTIVDDSNSPSGKSIVFNTAGSTLTTLAQVITIAYTSVTPVANTTLYAGTSSTSLSAFSIKFTHTNSSSVIDYEAEIYAATPNTGSLLFGFKGANADGVDELTFSFTGDLDSSLTDGRQLLKWYSVA